MTTKTRSKLKRKKQHYPFLSPHWCWKMSILLYGRFSKGNSQGLNRLQEHPGTTALQLARWAEKGNHNLPGYVPPLCTIWKAWAAIIQSSKKTKKWDLIRFFVIYYSKLVFSRTVSISVLSRKQPYKNTSVWVLSHTTGVWSLERGRERSEFALYCFLHFLPSPIVTSTSYLFTAALLASGFLGNSSLSLRSLSHLKDCLVTPPKHFSRVWSMHFASPKWKKLEYLACLARERQIGNAP